MRGIKLTVEYRGIGPLLSACKADVLPLSLIPHKLRRHELNVRAFASKANINTSIETAAVTVVGIEPTLKRL